MPDDFESNPFSRSVDGIHKAGNYAIRIMSWLVRDVYVNNFNYYDLIGTALTHSYRFLQSGLDGLIKTLHEDDLIILKKEFPDILPNSSIRMEQINTIQYNWQLLNKKLAYPYEYFKSLEDYDLPITNLTKEDYFSKLKNGYPDDEEIERTNKIIETFNIKTGKELTELYLKSDVILLADVFEKFIKVSIKEFEINPLYCVSLPGYTWECGMKYTEY